MSEKTLARLVGALLIVVALWGATTLLSRRGGGVPEAPDALSSFFEGVTADAVTAVRMTSAGEQVELTKDGDEWLVNGLPTDSGTVARFWSAMAEFSVGDLAATNPSNHARMGVATDSAGEFTLEIGGASRTLLVGGQGPRYGTAYARLPGASDVYLLDGNLQVHVRRRLDEWRNKRMAAVDTAAVASVQVTRADDAYVINRADSVWTLDDGSEAKASAVRNMLQELASLQAAGFLDEADSIASLPEGGSVAAFSADGTELARVTLGSGEGDRWGRAEGDDVLYKLPSWRIDRVAPRLEVMKGS